MAAMFKKSKRNFRRKNIDQDDEDGEVGSPMDVDAVPETPEIPFLTDKPKSKKPPGKVPAASSLLSFDDELAADDGVEFKVKKSKESRKLAKKLVQGKKKKGKDKISEKIEDKPEDDINHEDTSPTNEQLAALRAELSKMSRGEDEDEDEDEDEESNKLRMANTGSDSFHGSKIRTANTGFDSSHSSTSHLFSIPDAQAIYDARKKREMARQLGSAQDFIPLDDTKRYEGRFTNSTVKSRLVREDDNDGSDDEDGPMSFSAAAGKKSYPAMDRRREVQSALLVDEENEERKDEDGEIQRWEEEQIRKGVSAQQIPDQQQLADQEEQLTSSQSTLFNQLPYMYGGSYVSGTYSIQANGTSTAVTSQLPQQAVTVDMICDKMNQRLLSLQEVHRSHKLEQDKLLSHVQTAETSIENLQQQGTDAEKRFGFFQEMRGYVRDMIECLNEKVGGTSMAHPWDPCLFRSSTMFWLCLVC